MLTLTHSLALLILCFHWMQPPGNHFKKYSYIYSHTQKMDLSEGNALRKYMVFYIKPTYLVMPSPVVKKGSRSTKKLESLLDLSESEFTFSVHSEEDLGIMLDFSFLSTPTSIHRQIHVKIHVRSMHFSPPPEPPLGQVTSMLALGWMVSRLQLSPPHTHTYVFSTRTERLVLNCQPNHVTTTATPPALKILNNSPFHS